MFDSSWIDLAIGIAFVWFAFSLAITAINELLTRVFAMRSNQLWTALSQMLDGKYQSPSILGSVGDLFKPSFRPKSPRPTAAQAPPTADAVSAGDATQALYGTAAIQGMEPRTGDTKRTRISSIPAPVFSQGIVEMALQSGHNVAGYILALPGTTPIEQQLKVLWETASYDVKEFRSQVEQWFDSQMTRLSAAYKARVRYVLVPLGIVVAVVGFAGGLRSDAIALVGDLQHDQNLRTVVVGAASRATQTKLSDLGCPGSDAAGAAPSGSDAKSRPSDIECQIRGAAKLSNIDLILQADRPAAGDDIGERLGFLFSHVWVLLGVLITGVAISFGSTFWFDVTRRLVGLRSSSTAGS